MNPNSSYNHPASPVPVVGFMSVSGRARDMEDAYSVRPNLCSPEINGRQPLHYYAVFDGHGGAHVATLCRERMHALLEEELARAWHDSGVTGAGAGSSSGAAATGRGAWTTAMTNCFRRIDEIAVRVCEACGSEAECGCEGRNRVGLVGSTAVVVVVTAEQIVVANCGDSRAVLRRGGRAYALSRDHKPDRPDERARIEALGGRIIHTDGPRVGGILAMSRAIGDAFLKPYVSAEPEVTFVRRRQGDEMIIIASDGLWDVVSNEMACEVARQCLREDDAVVGPNEPTFFASQSASAAALLTRLAMGRNSGDNITVIVVDLNRSETIN